MLGLISVSPTSYSISTLPMSNQPALPSEIVQPAHQGNESVVADQQAATQPGSGSAVPADLDHSANAHAEQHLQEEGKLPFKEQVKAYAKIHRGTLLPGHKEEKEVGQKILAGEIDPPAPLH
ncbi:hypothetical protein RSOLAG22IIIB_07836 [Rhizoctonia solani]|uniref:Uncharacterized protein n=1 Tax=Rhizoctonia solani TaxID=456999 RepID=A0A0K6FQ30_9AGAM|nr:hypothetical protein RSOLAG22IIIB_07836 [Rhizoctonia solani]